MNASLQRHYLLVVFVLIMASVFLRSIYDFHKYQQTLETDIQKLEESTRAYYDDLQTALIERYLTLVNHYSNEAVLIATIKQGNTQQLYQYSKFDYEKLQQDNPYLHVMHFFDTRNVTLLRNHQPENYGDNLTHLRPIVRDANASKTPLHGFEVGKNGITYRISTPLIERNGVHFGLLEFGIRPHYFVDKLTKRFGVESLILVKTESLNILTQGHAFEPLGSYSITLKTNFFQPLLASLDLANPISRIKVRGEHFIILNNLNLLDHQGNVAAKIVVAKNITDLVKQNHNELIKANMVNLLVLLVLFGVVYFVFNQYAKALIGSENTIQNLSHSQELLKNQANTDELTGLYNRRFFNQTLEKLLKEGQTGSLYFFDIDHFKNLNDTHGHLAGDKVLAELANMMRGFFRQNDLLVRWGGEEFAVFVGNIDQNVMLYKAETFRVYVEQTVTEKQPYPITISGGVTNIRPNEDAASLIKRADSRLYQAKQSGRNRTIGNQDDIET